MASVGSCEAVRGRAPEIPNLLEELDPADFSEICQVSSFQPISVKYVG